MNDLGNFLGCAWGDYDNDGFLDLFVANGAVPRLNVRNVLYRNSRNGNGWLNIKCVGTFSNRSAIGTKVRVKATIGGKNYWQLREISGTTGYACQNDIRANFGLGEDNLRPSASVAIGDHPKCRMAVKRFCR